jgi:uncharacterized membrane protein
MRGPSGTVAAPGGEPEDAARVAVAAAELRLGLLLRGGVSLAGILLALAWIGAVTTGVPLQSGGVPLSHILRGKVSGWDMLAQLGILSLGITPVARVLLSIPIFARAGERSQAWIAAAVLALLMLGMALGAVE